MNWLDIFSSLFPAARPALPIEPPTYSVPHDNIRPFLDTLADCEGTAGPDGYHIRFGGKRFASLADHPRIASPFINKDGVQQWSSAAGRYQEIKATFERLSKKLGTTDFSEATQDAHAIELIRECLAYDAVVEGRIAEAARLCAPVWASLPDSPYPQPTKSLAYVERQFVAHGGILA